MNIRKELLQERSKHQTIRIVNYIGNEPDRFAELIDLLLADDSLLSERAAWPLSFCIENHPELILPHLEGIIQNLRKPDLHDAVKRSTLRSMQFITIPDELLGKAADICFEFLASKQEPVAVKIFSMTVLFNISKKIPELKKELKYYIEEKLPFGSAGFRSRGRAILKKI